MIKVILRKDIERIGKAAEIVSVKEGFARNYLFPRNLAILATKENISKIEKEKSRDEQKRELLKKQAEQQVKSLENYSCTIAVEAQDENLYGAVNAQDIVEALAEDNINISKDCVLLDKPIKKLGIYEVELKLFQDVRAKIKVWVVKK